MQAMGAGGLVFQVIHALEHFLQFAIWFTDRETPWLSSWAAGTAEGLQYFCSLVPLADTPTSIGVEMLHLTGNTIFLGALTAWQVAMRRTGRNITALNIAEKVQFFHVAEHLLLVVSLIGFGEAMGISTGFGVLSGTTLVAVRVWFHFAVNAVATGFALRAANDTWRKPSHKTKAVVDLVAAEQIDLNSSEPSRQLR